MEASELGYGTAVKKLCLLTFDAIIKIFQMHIAYEMDEEGEPPAIISFETRRDSMYRNAVCKTARQNTKAEDPVPQRFPVLYYLVIGRLGGWKGYTYERRPGLTALWIGLEKFYNIFEGWAMAQDVYTR